MPGAITVEELQILITTKYVDAIRDMLKMVKEFKQIANTKLAPVQKEMQKAMTPSAQSTQKTVEAAQKATSAIKQTVKTAADETKKLANEAARAAEAALSKVKTPKVAEFSKGQLRGDSASQKDIDIFKKRLDANREQYKQLQAEYELRRKIALENKETNKPMKFIPLDELRKSESLFRKVARSFSSLKKSIGSGLPNVLKKIGSGFKSLGSAIGKKLTDGLKKVGQGFKNIAKNGIKIPGFLRKIVDSFAFIIRFRVIFGILNQINEAFKVGTDNLYQYSKIAGGTFAASMDKLATSLQYFQNSIGAAVSPIIESFAPAIDMMVDKIVELINYLNQLFSKLAGKSTWTKAVKVQKEYAEAAGEAAEKTNLMLASFDEVNIITQSQDKSDSGTPDYGSMFEEVELDADKIDTTLIDDIKEKIKDNDWEGVGTTLADELNKVIDNMDLTDLGKKIGNWINNALDALYSFLDGVNWDGLGQKLAAGLNSIIETVDWTTLGNTIAAGFNAVFGFLNGFFKEFDWSNLGISLGNGINGFIDELHWGEIGETLSNGFNGVITTLHDAIETVKWGELGAQFARLCEATFIRVDWEKVGNTLSDGVRAAFKTVNTFLDTFSWKELGIAIGKFFNDIDYAGIIGDATHALSSLTKGLLDFISGAIQGINWVYLGQQLWESLVALFTSIDYDGLAASLWNLIGSALGAAVSLIVGFAKGIWDSIVKAFNSTFEYFRKNIEDCGGNVVAGIFKGILDYLISLPKWIYDNMLVPFVQGFRDAFGIHSPSTVMAEQGGYIVEGLYKGIVDKINSVKKIWEDFKTTVIRIFESMWNGIKRPINSILGGVEKMANGVVRGINGMIRALNNLSFDVPDWVPLIGGETFGFNIREISEVYIPRLANGGVISSPTLGMIGEYAGANRNPEIVTPQNIMYETVVEANAPLISALYDMVREIIAEIRDKDTTIEIDGDVIGSVASRHIDRYNRRVGLA